MRNIFFMLILIAVHPALFGQNILDTDGDWATGTNWDSNTPTDGITTSEIAGNTDGAINDGESFTSGQLTFGNSASLTLNGTSSLDIGDVGNALDLVATNGATITVSANGTFTIWGDLIVNNNLTLNISGSLIIKGNVTMNNGGDLTVSGSGTLTVGGNFTGANNTTITTTGSGSIAVTGDLSLGGGTSSITGADGSITAGTCACTGCGGCPTTVTPIVLTYFGAKSLENVIELKWTTASEENNDYFTLERSSNGLDFHVLTRVDGAGNSFEILNYSSKDKNPFQGVSYYRLKQTDYDGTNETFKVVVAEFYGEASPVKVFQSLISDNELIIINNLDEENIAYIYDMMGRGGKVGILKKGENNLSIDQFKIQSGMYTLRVVNSLGKVLASQKFVVR